MEVLDGCDLEEIGLDTVRSGCHDGTGTIVRRCIDD